MVLKVLGRLLTPRGYKPGNKVVKGRDKTLGFPSWFKAGLCINLLGLFPGFLSVLLF